MKDKFDLVSSIIQIIIMILAILALILVWNDIDKSNTFKIGQIIITIGCIYGVCWSMKTSK